MRKPFLALITPLATPEEPVQPPGIWGGGNVPMPSPPIQLPPWLITGGQPPGIWGGGGVPMPDNPIMGVPGAPGYQPPSGSPPGFWGPNDPRPSNPIQLPWWAWSGQGPPGTWGGGNVPMPNPPIYLPPELLPPEITIPEGKSLVVVFTPGQGYKAELIPTPGPGYSPPPGGAVPAPTKK